MLKKITFLTFVLAVLFLLNTDSQAQSQDFSMTNNTGMTLIDVYLSPTSSDNWGSDVIPGDLILDGETFNFTFTGFDKDNCLWDIKFTADDGNSYTMTGVDLCAITTITLTKN